MRRSPLTKIQGCWRTKSCPKLPQRHPRCVRTGSVRNRGRRSVPMSFDFLHGLAAFGIIPFLVVLTIVVFFHEFGHFLVARWFGAKSLTFSTGFAPDLLGFNALPATRWKSSPIPLAGLVQSVADEIPTT